jgi:cytochrome c oxidase assembly factor CtaG
MIAAPLLWLGKPFPVMLWGMPAPVRKWVGSLFTREAQFRLVLRATTNAGIVWFAFIAIYMGWHDPNLYDLALRYPWVHDLQHLTFFAAAMLFWWHIVGAAPHIHGRTVVWGRLAMLIGVIPAQMIAGIIIATANEVIYTYYATVPHIWGFTALEDQAIAGVIMWIPSSEMLVWAVVFLLAGLFKREEKRPETRVVGSQTVRPMSLVTGHLSMVYDSVHEKPMTNDK